MSLDGGTFRAPESGEAAVVVTVSEWAGLWDEDMGAVERPEDVGLTQPMDFAFTYGQVWKALPDGEFDESESDDAAILDTLCRRIGHETAGSVGKASLRWLPVAGL